MRFLIVMNKKDVSLGGLEGYGQGLKEGLEDLGYEVEVWGFDSNQKPLVTLAGRFPIPRLSQLVGPSGLLNKAKKADRVFLLSHLFLHSLVCVLTQPSKKLLLISHSSGFVPMKNSLIGALAKFWEQSVLFAARIRKTHFLAVSEGVREWLEKFEIFAVAKISAGIEPGLSNHGPKTKDSFAYVGRLVEGKGADAACEIFEKTVAPVLPNATLSVVGAGPLLGRLKKQYSGNKSIRILGQMPHDRVLNLLEESEVFLYPSVYPEGMPNVLLEAGLAGCQIYCTSVAGSAELFPNDNYGVVRDTKSALQKQLELDIRYPPDKVARASRINQRISDTFSWKSIAKKIADVAIGLESLQKRGDLTSGS